MKEINSNCKVQNAKCKIITKSGSFSFEIIKKQAELYFTSGKNATKSPMHKVSQSINYL
jgi:hypothetical protein